MCNHQKIERNYGNGTSLVLFFSLFGTCVARESGTDTGMILGISLPFAILFVSATAICACFWFSYCRVSMLAKRPSRPRRQQRYVFNYQRPHQPAVHPENQATIYCNGQSDSAETTATSSDSTTLSLSQLQGTVTDSSSSSSSTAFNLLPSRQVNYSGQGAVQSSVVTVATHATQPASALTSESAHIITQSSTAELHQGDAPPTYAEAMNMKTCIANHRGDLS